MRFNEEQVQEHFLSVWVEFQIILYKIKLFILISVSVSFQVLKIQVLKNYTKRRTLSAMIDQKHLMINALWIFSVVL